MWCHFVLVKKLQFPILKPSKFQLRHFFSGRQTNSQKQKNVDSCEEEGGDTDLLTCTSNGESSSMAESSESKQGVPTAES